MCSSFRTRSSNSSDLSGVLFCPTMLAAWREKSHRGRSSLILVFTTFEIDFEKQHEKVDLAYGRVVEYDPNAYVEVHTQSAAVPEYSNMVAAAPRFDGEFPCVFVEVGASGAAPQFGQCAMPTVHAEPVDRFEADLRYGRFVLRESDLFLDDVFKVPLTRSYSSADWVHSNPVHAFGRNSNHPFDIAPVGSRNPYTHQMICLEDGDFLYFDRVSKGTGYADAVYQHTETSTRFYEATQSWNGKLTSFACRRPSGHPERWLGCICGMTQSSLGVLHGSVLKVRAQSAAHHLTRTRRLGDSMSHSSAFVSNSKPNLPPLRGILFKPSGMPGSSSFDKAVLRECRHGCADVGGASRTGR